MGSFDFFQVNLYYKNLYEYYYFWLILDTSSAHFFHVSDVLLMLDALGGKDRTDGQLSDG